MPSCNTSPGITSNPSGTSGGLKERRSWLRSNEPGRQPLAKIKLSLLFKRRMTSYVHELSLILSATMSKVWFITGAGSGIGSGTAKATLRSGDRVVATGRNFEKVRNVYPDVAQENIAFVQLDVTNETEAKSALDEAMKR